MSGIDNAKRGMGWINPIARAACGNCRQVREENTSPGLCRPSWRCSKGGFLTPRFAVCAEYTPAIEPGSVPI